MKKKLSISEINGDLIPVASVEKECEYHNKKLRNYTHDDFASMVLDRCTLENVFVYGGDGFTKRYECDYLNYIPKNYARVYLYGVFEVIKDGIRVNDRLKQKNVLVP